MFSSYSPRVFPFSFRQNILFLPFAAKVETKPETKTGISASNEPMVLVSVLVLVLGLGFDLLPVHFYTADHIVATAQGGNILELLTAHKKLGNFPLFVGPVQVHALFELSSS